MGKSSDILLWRSVITYPMSAPGSLKNHTNLCVSMVHSHVFLVFVVPENSLMSSPFGTSKLGRPKKLLLFSPLVSEKWMHLKIFKKNHTHTFSAL